MASIVLYNGVPTMAGHFGAASIATMQSRGVEVLSDFDASDVIEVADITDEGGCSWRFRSSAAAGTPASTAPAAAPDTRPCILYLKDYSDEEMVAAAGESGFHAGWTVSGFIDAFPELVNAAAVVSAVAAMPMLAEMGIISVEALARLKACAKEGAGVR
jgi:hypothetical protein